MNLYSAKARLDGSYIDVLVKQENIPCYTMFFELDEARVVMEALQECIEKLDADVPEIIPGTKDDLNKLSIRGES
jgi:hypothetical protein